MSSIDTWSFGSRIKVFLFEFRWLRDNLDVIRDVNELSEVISTVEDCGDVYFVPAFSGLFAPYWKKEARG